MWAIRANYYREGLQTRYAILLERIKHDRDFWRRLNQHASELSPEEEYFVRPFLDEYRKEQFNRSLDDMFGHIDNALRKINDLEGLR